MGGLTAEVYDILYQSTKLRPGGGRNNNFGDQAPRLSQGLDDRVPSGSRSRTAQCYAT